MRLSYFKSIEGILRVCALLFGIITLGISAYSHFNSHWTSHNNIQIDKGNQVFQNDYEDCVQNRRSLSRRQTINPGLYDRGEYHSGLMIHCPKPSAELFLVSASVLVVILSLISVIVSGIAKPGALMGPLKPFDVTVQGTSAFCFLLGGILFMYSAYFISDWCAVKSKEPVARYAIDVDPNQQSQFRIGNNLLLRKVIEDGRYYSSDKDIIEGNNLNMVDVETDPKDDFKDEMVVHSEETCNLQELTEEKYWSGVLAILTALLHGATLGFMLKSSRGSAQHSNNRRVQRVSDQEGLSSADKGVGPGPSLRGSLFPDSHVV
ncbi:unnamed protein product [Orchesella dallaii]|uniref:Uncharacterized protein n=1 Tax=Orchesella dallaii TaxID=48710 RepID=A0ABP1R9U8_9HEXA